MAIDTLKRTLIFLLLCLTQALVLGRLQLFNCATPLLYIYFVLMFPRNYPKWAMLLWAFVMGLTVDMFANTPGLASGTLTLTAVLQPYLLELFIPHEMQEEEHVESSAHQLGWGRFLALTLLLVTLYCLVFFALEAFNFFNWQHWLLASGGSAALTTLLIMTLESIRK